MLKPVDFSLLFITIAILGFGLIMVLTSGSVRGYYSTENTYFFFLQQLKWTVVGCTVGWLFYKIPYHFWRRWAGMGIIVVILLLIAVILWGDVTKGSARWLRVGPFSLQPSEIAKLAIVLFLAHSLDRYPVKRIKDLVLPLVLLTPVFLFVYKQPDLGTTIVLLLTCAAMVWQTEIKLFWFLIAVPLLGGPLAYLVRHTDYQWKRILAWLNPWAYATDIGWQITNAQIAFGTGGLFGVGLGNSVQKYGFLSENHTDTIFAIVGEELGFVGSISLVLAFALLITRGFMISNQCPDRFGRLLGFGITFSLAIQIVINLAVVTGLFPVTGITLPLVSYGGSSLIITLAEIGILLNLSRYRVEPVGIKDSRGVSM